MGRPRKPTGEGKPVRIDSEIVGKATVVAGRRNLKIGPYLSQLLEAPVNRDYFAVLKEMSRNPMFHKFQMGDRVRWRRKGLFGHVISQTFSAKHGRRLRLGYRIGITVVMGDDPTGLGLNRQTREADVPASQLGPA